MSRPPSSWPPASSQSAYCWAPSAARPRIPRERVDRVIDGDTFACTDGTRVRLLQINTPELGECGGEWAKAALGNIFLTPGTSARLDYDEVVEDRYGCYLRAGRGDPDSSRRHVPSYPSGRRPQSTITCV
jgi:endonuclease YncB( thermonuclease family)